MRNVVLQTGSSIDGYVSGGPETDIGAGEAEHPDVTSYPDGTVISIHRRPR